MTRISGDGVECVRPTHVYSLSRFHFIQTLISCHIETILVHIQLKQTYEFTLIPNSMHIWIWRLENVHSERQPNGTYFQFHPSSIVNIKHIHTAVYGIGHIVPLCSVLGCIVGITTHFQLSAVPFGCADASSLCVCVCVVDAFLVQ